MNAFLSFAIISLCGITNGLHLPVVARRPSNSGAMCIQKLHIDENLDNARDVVVSVAPSIL
jgi:hypothetical protein